MVQAGLSEYYARFFTSVEVKASEGLETALKSVVENMCSAATLKRARVVSGKVIHDSSEDHDRRTRKWGTVAA